MIDISDVENTIKDLEKSGTSYYNCAKLADLYTVRNEYYNKRNKNIKDDTKMEYSYAGKSEFIELFEKADYQKALNIMNQHMDCIKALYPKEYKKICALLSNAI